MIPAQYDKNVYFQSTSLASPISKLQVRSPAKSYSHVSTSKFSIARIETDRLANIMSKSGQKTFDSRLNVVKNLAEAFAEKKDVRILTSNVNLSSESSDEDTIVSSSAKSSPLPPISRAQTSKSLNVSSSSKSSSLPPISRTETETPNIRPQRRERFVGRPSTQTAIGKTRSRPKPSLCKRKNKKLTITPLGASPIKRLKNEINIADEVCYNYLLESLF
jgi:hypothetical protein